MELGQIRLVPTTRVRIWGVPAVDDYRGAEIHFALSMVSLWFAYIADEISFVPPGLSRSAAARSSEP
jgi:hypothetical protein